MNLFIILLCFIWGINWVFMKIAMLYFPPIMFSALRFLLGAITLLIICFYKKVPLPSRSHLKWFILIGFLQTFYIHLALQIAIKYIDAGISALIYYTMPFWLNIHAHFFIPGEKMTYKRSIGLMSGILGLFLILDIRPDSIATNFQFNLLPELVVLSGSIIWAISNLISQKFLKSVNTLQFTTYQMLIGSVPLIICAFAFESFNSIIWSVNSVLLLLFSGIVASAVTFILWFYILSNTSASKSSVSLLLTPVFGVIFSTLILKEPITPVIILGIFMILLGIFIVNSKKLETDSTEKFDSTPSKNM